MSARLSLFWLSFLVLFVELVLIRWASAYVIYLSYFTNFVLLASFLGIGIGFLRPRPGLFRLAPLVLALLIGFIYFFPTKLSRPDGKLVYFGSHTGGTPIWIALPVIFLAVALALMTVAGLAAHFFSKLKPLTAYRYDILGSLAGVVTFAVLSFLSAPPLAWGGVIGAVFLGLYGRSVRLLQLLPLAALLATLGLGSFATGVRWSPYYAIKVERSGPATYRVLVNGVPHQSVESLSLRARHASYYFTPYLRLRGNPLRDVLVVGAGNGIDVAVALRQHARHVDAVEIDPKLLAIGRALNPDRPYRDPRVTTYVTDGRAFLERHRKRYDFILFALPDSLTLVANQSSLRLESYLFTLDAFRTVRAHLNPGGAFAMYNFYRRQWLVDRFARSLTQAFGRAPCVDELLDFGPLRGPMADLTVGTARGAVSCPRPWSEAAGAPAPVTGDRPFPYLKSRGLPGFYLLTLLLILSVSVAGVRVAAGPLRTMRPYLDLFFMGTAFLLLETKSVVQFALLFGTTWIVNAFVFGGVLVAVPAAIETAEQLRLRRPRLLYAPLAASLALAWAIPPRWLLGLAFAPRLAAGIALAFVPIFLANLIFAERFRESQSSTTAFGANLIGAMIGGLLEYSSLVLGYRNLILVVAGLYGLALLGSRRGVAVPGFPIFRRLLPDGARGSLGDG